MGPKAGNAPGPCVEREFSDLPPEASAAEAEFYMPHDDGTRRGGKSRPSTQYHTASEEPHELVQDFLNAHVRVARAFVLDRIDALVADLL